MDLSGVARCVTLEWHDGFGETLAAHLSIFNAHPGRFAVFGNIDFRRINEPDFARAACAQMERDVAAGMRGLKVYKALGLEYRQENGELWRVNDGRLDPIWAKAGELAIPVLIHIADPPEFWTPVNDRNPWNGVLYGEYAWWSYYRKGLASPEELLGERNEVIARHPGTLFICPHVGSYAHDLTKAAEDLDTFDNLFYDISARIPELGAPENRREAARQFLIDYQDRILFGTDVIFDHTNVAFGVQAQSLYQPGEIPLNGRDPHEEYVRSTAEFVRSNVLFLSTGEVQERPPFKRTRKAYSIKGLALPEMVLDKLFWKNADRLVPFTS
jgi:predicted TIM-barrel fold metal-dependent hydrolase